LCCIGFDHDCSISFNRDWELSDRIRGSRTDLASLRSIVLVEDCSFNNFHVHGCAQSRRSSLLRPPLRSRCCFSDSRWVPFRAAATNGVYSGSGLLTDGFAWLTYDKSAEADAREHQRVLWADPNPTPPWEWRKAKRKLSTASDGRNLTASPTGSNRGRSQAEETLGTRSKVRDPGMAENPLRNFAIRPAGPADVPVLFPKITRFSSARA